MNTSSPRGLRRFQQHVELPRHWSDGAGRCAAMGHPHQRAPWVFFVVLLGLVLALLPLTGCNMVAAFDYIINGEPTIDPEFTQLEDAKVVVVCYVPAKFRYSFDSVDTDIAKKLSRLLQEKVDDIEVVESDLVASWLDQHANWSDVTEIGKEFQADYVVFADIQEFSIYEENSPNMYRGRSYVDIRVYDVKNDGDIIYEIDLESLYPLGRPIPVGEKREKSFRREYVVRLSDEIGRHFYPYIPGEDVKLY